MIIGKGEMAGNFVEGRGFSGQYTGLLIQVDKFGAFFPAVD